MAEQPGNYNLEPPESGKDLKDVEFWHKTTIHDGSSCVSGGYNLEFAAIAFTASTYKRWRERRKSRHKCLSHKSLR